MIITMKNIREGMWVKDIWMMYLGKVIRLDGKLAIQWTHSKFGPVQSFKTTDNLEYNLKTKDIHELTPEEYRKIIAEGI